AREEGCKAGVVINPATPVESLSEVLNQVGQVLVMSVNPGYGGQAFIPHSLEKIRQLRDLRARYHYNYRIEVDGGGGPDNVAELVRAGAEILVAGTSVFHTPDPAEAVRRMQQIATDAVAEKVGGADCEICAKLGTGGNFFGDGCGARSARFRPIASQKEKDGARGAEKRFTGP